MVRMFAIGICILFLQGCITKIVTVPVKVAYKATKGVVKGTVAVVGAVVPHGHDDADSNEDDEDNLK
jgi:hypothetical protein